MEAHADMPREDHHFTLDHQVTIQELNPDCWGVNPTCWPQYYCDLPSPIHYVHLKKWYLLCFSKNIWKSIWKSISSHCWAETRGLRPHNKEALHYVEAQPQFWGFRRWYIGTQNLIHDNKIFWQRWKEARQQKSFNMALFSQSYKIILCQMKLSNFLWLMWDHYVS